LKTGQSSKGCDELIWKILDISDTELYEFLSYCMFPSSDRIALECSRYRSQPDRELYGTFSEGRLTGLIGLIHGESETELKHIAMRPEYRNMGYGSQLIRTALEVKKNKILYAETDHDAVGFYKKNGFKISSLGEKYPGVERFRCVYDCKENLPG